MAYFGYAPLAKASFAKAAKFRETRFALMRKGFIGDVMAAGVPQCPSCRRCVSLRINLFEHRFTDDEQRLMDRFDREVGEVIWAKPEELGLDIPEHFTTYYTLYNDYLKDRFPASSMVDEEPVVFQSILMSKSDTMVMIDQEGALLAFAQIDRFNHEASFDYIAYDPVYKDLRMGHIGWLQTMQWAKDEMIAHLYIGPTNNTPSMRYKQRYSALETYDGDKWVPYDPKTHRDAPDMAAQLQKLGYTPAP